MHLQIGGDDAHVAAQAVQAGTVYGRGPGGGSPLTAAAVYESPDRCGVAACFNTSSVRAAVRTRVRNRLLGMLARPLALCAAGAVLFADPIVPWIFGPTWRPTVELLAALWGLVLFASLFEVLKGYCIVTFRARILLLARAAQYLGLALPFAVLLLFPGRPGLTWLAAGVSIGFALAFAAMLAVLRRTESRPRTGPRA